MAGVNVCIKCSMFIFNFVFWLCGAIILSIAISIRAGKIGQEILVPGDANLSPFIVVNMLIFVGAVIMILGFLGCCGAMKENQFMMILLKCCGLVNGASDWGSNFQHYYKTCECPGESDPSCTKYSGKAIYKQSCFASINHIFSRRFFIVIALAFGLAAIEVLGLIFSIVLYCQMRKK